jgi:hypothetical protein
VRQRLMYLEAKGPKATKDSARICRMTQVKLGHMIYHADKAFIPQRNRGSGANFVETHTGDPYWISPCRKDGCDSLDQRVVQIDEDVRDEYWTNVRGMPEQANQPTYQSPGRTPAPVA